MGDKVEKKFKKGDRICGCAHGGNASNKEDGVFAEYAVVKGGTFCLSFLVVWS